MNKTKRNNSILTIGLLSHMLIEGNLGCVALSIANISLIDRAVKEAGRTAKYVILVTDKIKQAPLDFIDAEYEYRVFPGSKQTLRNPVKLLRTNCFDGCDIVFNICAGDGYTDIYGFPRLISESYMSILCHKKHIPIVFSPQTIGPFGSAKARAIARKTLSGLTELFVRDSMSANCCKDLGLNVPIYEVIDVAFALPFERMKASGSKVKFGLNVSGLLYNGGYDKKNYFGLTIDYKNYIDSLVDMVMGLEDVELHLIPHVIHENPVEDDYAVCQSLCATHPGAVLAPRFHSPIEAKSYISAMDFFTGARMHSTIAAISSGVPVVPLAYSRKVNGLYGTLEYPYFIDAKSIASEDEALHETIDLFIRREELAECERVHSMPIYESRLKLYTKRLKDLVDTL